jgi:MFS family permease
MAASGVGGVVGGLLATWTLGHWDFPRNFAYLFIAAGLTMAGSMTLYLFVHETVPPGQAPPTESSLVRIVRGLWAGDRRLRRLTLVRYVSEFGAAGGTFLAVYALARFALPDRAAGTFSLALCLGQAVGSLLVGRLGDRRGYRRVMGWGMICTAAALALALAVRRPEVMYAVFALVGTAMAADWVSYVNLLVEMSDESTRGYYQALGATLALPPRLLGPVFWGWLGDRLGLPWVFAGALLLVATGWLLLVTLVDDPRRPGQRVLRVAQGWRIYWR